jgi:hypothetical protein
MHDEPLGQALPQLPQLALSESALTQVPRHESPARGNAPIAQRQSPSLHVVPDGHVVPHAPQLLLLLSSDTHTPEQRVCTPGHGMTQVPPLHTCPEGHALPQRPQLPFETRVSISHPSLATRLQSAKPMLHTRPHTPPVQVAIDRGPDTHDRRHPPQLNTSVESVASQPLLRSPSQFPRPSPQVVVHTPRAQVAMPHPLLQRPQWVLLSSVFTSHPLSAMPSQSAKPGSQRAIVQAPIAQPAIALARRHARPHMPQLSASAAVLDSHPVVGSMSQSAKPALHRSMAHAPIEHVPSALRGAHARAHTPQWVLLARRSVSQPFAVFMSQSPKPTSQRNVQRPDSHAAVAFAPPMHVVPHRPQCMGSVSVLVSQPFAAIVSQLS